MEKPKFKNCFRVEVVAPEGVFLISDRESFLLSDRYSQIIAPLIDGNRTADEIINELSEQISPAEAYYTLMLLEQKGYIVESEDIASTEAAAFWQMAAMSNHALEMGTPQIAVFSCGDVATAPLISALQSLKIAIDDRADRVVVITDDYLNPRLDTFNQKFLQSQIPWMLVKPTGSVIWIGPIFHPDKTACWECLAQRQRINRPLEAFIQRRKNTSHPLTPPPASLPTTEQTAINIAATEIAKWILRGENQQLEGNLVTLDTHTLQMQNHKVVRRPQCPACGNNQYHSNRQPTQLILASRQKIFTADGGHRCVTPAETLEKYQHHISPITGVVRALKRVSNNENKWIHNYLAGHNFAAMFDDLYFLRQNIRGRSGGKGATDLQAKASGFCEAIERYSGIFQGDEIRQKSTYRLLGGAAIHPNFCLNFSDTQYRNRREWNAQCAVTQRVPEPFDEDAEIEWTPVWSLTHQDWKFLPTAYCYYGYPLTQNPYCWADSNGAAAGNTIEEAILQGFMELVERDSVCLWWYDRLRRPGVNLETFGEPYFQQLKQYYRSLQRDVWVLDITSDMNIPAFVAISGGTEPGAENFIFGFGAHFDAKLAISRALTEMNQSIPAVLPGSRIEGAIKSESIENQDYLHPDTNLPLKGRDDYPHQGSDDLLEDIMTAVDLAAQNGLEMLVLDQTRPDIGLNVVKVIIPGLRHFWKRLGPGRLQDVPVKMGWLKEPLSERLLNPLDLFKN